MIQNHMCCAVPELLLRAASSSFANLMPTCLHHWSCIRCVANFNWNENQMKNFFQSTSARAFLVQICSIGIAAKILSLFTSTQEFDRLRRFFFIGKCSIKSNIQWTFHETQSKKCAFCSPYLKILVNKQLCGKHRFFLEEKLNWYGTR